MTTTSVRPGIAEGSVVAPPSKSYTHRALVVGHLAHRRFEVVDPLDSDDTRATVRAVTGLGSRVHRGPGRWVVEPGVRRARGRRRVDCGESGTTLRFSVALAAREDHPVEFRGKGRLERRPIEELLAAVRGLGASTEQPGGPGRFPILVRGPIHGGTVTVDASRSSQFGSALLLTLPTVEGESRLRLRGRIVSRPYLEATLAVLRRHGIRFGSSGRRFDIPGDQVYRGARMRVTGDASSAAYLWAAAAVTGGRVRVRGVRVEWPQADLAVLDLLEQAGAGVVRTRDGATVEGRATNPFAVDLTDAPDLYPLAATVAATIRGRSRIGGATQVAHKESDRRAGAARLARAMGAEVAFRRGALEITGRQVPRAIRRAESADHRMVMSAAIGALSARSPSRIGDARSVAKSFPSFWTALAGLTGGEVG